MLFGRVVGGVRCWVAWGWETAADWRAWIGALLRRATALRWRTLPPAEDEVGHVASTTPEAGPETTTTPTTAAEVTRDGPVDPEEPGDTAPEVVASAATSDEATPREAPRAVAVFDATTVVAADGGEAPAETETVAVPLEDAHDDDDDPGRTAADHQELQPKEEEHHTIQQQQQQGNQEEDNVSKDVGVVANKKSVLELILESRAAVRVLVLEWLLEALDLVPLAACDRELAALASRSLRSSHCLELIRTVAQSKVVDDKVVKFHAIAKYVDDGRAYDLAAALLAAPPTLLTPTTLALGPPRDAGADAGLNATPGGPLLPTSPHHDATGAEALLLNDQHPDDDDLVYCSRSLVQALVFAHPPTGVGQYDVVDAYFDGVAAAVDEAGPQTVRDYALSAWVAVAVDTDRRLDDRCLAVATVVDFSGFCLYDRPERRFLQDALDELRDLWDERFFFDDDEEGYDDRPGTTGGGTDLLLEDESPLHRLRTDTDAEDDDEEEEDEDDDEHDEEDNEEEDEEDEEDEEEEEEEEDSFSCAEEAAFDVTPDRDVFCPRETANAFAALCRARLFFRLGNMLQRVDDERHKPKRRHSSPHLLAYLTAKAAGDTQTGPRARQPGSTTTTTGVMNNNNPSGGAKTKKVSQRKTSGSGDASDDEVRSRAPALCASQFGYAPHDPTAEAEDEAAEKALSLVQTMRDALDRHFVANDAASSYVLSRHADLIRLYQLHVVGSDARAGLARIVDLVQRDLPRFAALFFVLVDRVATRRKRDDLLDRASTRRGRDEGYMLRTYVALFHVCELCLHTSPRAIRRQLRDPSSVSRFLVGYRAVLAVLPTLFRRVDAFAKATALAALDDANEPLSLLERGASEPVHSSDAAGEDQNAATSSSSSSSSSKKKHASGPSDHDAATDVPAATTTSTRGRSQSLSQRRAAGNTGDTVPPPRCADPRDSIHALLNSLPDSFASLDSSALASPQSTCG